MKTYSVTLTEEMIRTITYALDILSSDHSCSATDNKVFQDKEKSINKEIDAVENAIFKAIAKRKK